MLTIQCFTARTFTASIFNVEHAAQQMPESIRLSDDLMVATGDDLQLEGIGLARMLLSTDVRLPMLKPPARQSLHTFDAEWHAMPKGSLLSISSWRDGHGASPRPRRGRLSPFLIMVAPGYTWCIERIVHCERPREASPRTLLIDGRAPPKCAEHAVARNRSRGQFVVKFAMATRHAEIDMSRPRTPAESQ